MPVPFSFLKAATGGGGPPTDRTTNLLLQYWTVYMSTYLDGQAVPLLMDTGSLAKDATAAGAARPTWRINALGGNSAAEFDGGSNWMTLANAAIPATRTMWFVGKFAAQASGYGALLTENGSAGYFSRLNSGNRFLTSYGGGGGNDSGGNNADWAIYCHIETPSGWEWYINNVLTASGATPKGAFTANNLGNDAGGEAFKGYLLRLDVFGEAPDSTIRTGQFNYLKAFYGL